MNEKDSLIDASRALPDKAVARIPVENLTIGVIRWQSSSPPCYRQIGVSISNGSSEVVIPSNLARHLASAIEGKYPATAASLRGAANEVQAGAVTFGEIGLGDVDEPENSPDEIALAYCLFEVDPLE